MSFEINMLLLRLLRVRNVSGALLDHITEMELTCMFISFGRIISLQPITNENKY